MQSNSFFRTVYKLLKTSFFLMFAIVAIGSEAKATSFSLSDWKTAGDGLLTVYSGPAIENSSYDISRLEWLNVGLSLGMSFNEAHSQTATGQQFEGFRHATIYEIVGLMRGALGYEDWIVQSTESPDSILNFATLTSTPVSGAPWCCFTGAMYDTLDVGNVNAMLFYGAFGSSSVTQAVFDRNFTNQMLGNFLVRENLSPVSPVPIPASFVLFLSGIGVVGAMKRRHSKKKHSSQWC